MGNNFQILASRVLSPPSAARRDAHGRHFGSEWQVDCCWPSSGSAASRWSRSSPSARSAMCSIALREAGSGGTGLAGSVATGRADRLGRPGLARGSDANRAHRAFAENRHRDAISCRAGGSAYPWICGDRSRPALETLLVWYRRPNKPFVSTRIARLAAEIEKAVGFASESINRRLRAAMGTMEGE